MDQGSVPVQGSSTDTIVKAPCRWISEDTMRGSFNADVARALRTHIGSPIRLPS